MGEGLSVAEIAGRLGLRVSQAKYLLSAAGIRRVPNPARRAGFADLGDRAAAAFRAEVVRLYVDEGQTVRGIASRTGVDQRTVWRQLDAAGVPRRPPGRVPEVIPARELRRLCVTDGLSVTAIARRLEVNTSLVHRNLDRHGIARRNATPIPKRQLVDLYVKQGLGIKAVARTLGCSDQRVRDDLDRYGIALRAPGRQPKAAR